MYSVTKKIERGFTLIELLVVIAIIGMLASVVLASLNTARSRGGDAAIKSNMATIQVQAEIYYDGTGNKTYGTATAACDQMFADVTMAQAIAAINAANGAGSVVCNSSGSAYAVSSPLATSQALYWCVDSRGIKDESGTALGAGTVCP